VGALQERELALLRWGLIASWSKDPAIGAIMNPGCAVQSRACCCNRGRAPD